MTRFISPQDPTRELVEGVDFFLPRGNVYPNPLFHLRNDVCYCSEDKGFYTSCSKAASRFSHKPVTDEEFANFVKYGVLVK